MTIGDVARRTGVSIKALRFYDQLGILLVAGRSESNYRLFGDSVLACVQNIRSFREAGLTLRQIQELVRRTRAGEDPQAILRQACAVALARTEREIAALEVRRAQLTVLNDPSAEVVVSRGVTGRDHVTDRTVTTKTADTKAEHPAEAAQPTHAAPKRPPIGISCACGDE